MITKAKLFTLFLFYFFKIGYSQFYVPDIKVEKQIKKKITKKFRTFSRKQLLFKKKPDKINIKIVYWMNYELDSINKPFILTKDLMQEHLKFSYSYCTNKQLKKHCPVIIYYGIIYNQDGILAEFDQNDIYKPTNYGLNLFRTITNNPIKYIFKIGNLYTKGLPLFLVDKNGEIFVYQDKYAGKKILRNNTITPLNVFKPECCFEQYDY